MHHYSQHCQLCINRNIVHKKYAVVVTAKQDEYQTDEKETLELFRQAKSRRPLVNTAGNRVLRRAGRRPINSAMALLLLVLLLAVGALMVCDAYKLFVYYRLYTVRTTHLCIDNGWGRC